MRTKSLTREELGGVYAVPPLARNSDGKYSINFEQSQKLLDHIAGGGIRKFLYGGNAVMHHITLSDYQLLLEWLSGQPDEWWMIPSAGPAFGRAMDQAPLLKHNPFPAVMMLPCSDPKDTAGLEAGYRHFADASGKQLIIYIKTDQSLGADHRKGIEMLARLCDDDICLAIKYAIVREDPANDPYLDLLLRHVDPGKIVSGIGERPAVYHMEACKLPGFTTGSGCIQPKLCQDIYQYCTQKEFDQARTLRQLFMPLEDLRDAWNPIRVIHHAVTLSGIADMGPILPFLSALSDDQTQSVRPAAQTLVRAHQGG
jgi:dihydrodipicolinate synthase/N-acetylneuraminate lyase